jgi:hypothetical protein
MFSDCVEISPYLDNLKHDKRFGLTLITFPDNELQRQIENVQNRLRDIDPRHFYYVRESLHLSILNITSACEGFEMRSEDFQIYKKVISETLTQHRPVLIEFNGICATPNAIIAKGFFVNPNLIDIRNILKARLIKAGVGKQIDQRYFQDGAHITIARFKAKTGLIPLATQIAQFCNRSLGVLEIKSGRMVRNDFYMTPGKIEILEEFRFADPAPTQIK